MLSFFKKKKVVQVSFMAKEWVDHAFSKSWKAENKLAHLNKALAKVEKKYKDSLFHLNEAEKGRRSAEVALEGAENQVEEMRVSLKKIEMQLASTKEQIKLQLKEIKGKNAKNAKAEQIAYDAGMTKTTQSLTIQLKDVARAFCLEVWGEALNTARVSADFDLKGSDKVYYPSLLVLLLALPFLC